MSSDNKNAIFAVIVSGIILFGWQHFFAPKTNPVKTETSTTKVTTENTNVAAVPSETSKATTISPVSPVQDVQENQNFILKNGSHEVSFNSQLEFSTFNSSLSTLSLLELTDVNSPLAFEFETKDGYKKLFFNWTRNSDFEVLGTNEAYNLKVKLNLGFDGKLSYGFTSAQPIKMRAVFVSTKKELDGGHLREFTLLNKDLEKVAVGKSDEGEGETRWAGIDFNFHVLALSFNNKKLTNFRVTEDGHFFVTTSLASNDFAGSLIFAKKDYDSLTNLGEGFNLSIDYGMWSVIALPILRALQFFYKYVPNYGIAIILLTLFIRLLTFPLQYKSFKSMKKMQEIQPELTKLREKFKEDPQRLQKETMELFKKAGANPLGGCLPLLLQMPIFFAFYKVLFNSTELMGAPFFLWIKDLSIKDPFYVLPVLMAGAMFLQQKMTPTPTADPTQQKIMMFMPLVFALIMKDLPSGLTLYIFVSTILGIGQQMLVYKKS